jgi:adenosylcobinamide-phosphate synthase
MVSAPSTASLLIGALLVDLAVGEPPAPLHPVVWMGALGRRAERWLRGPAAPRPAGATVQLAGGLLLALALPALCATVGAVVLRAGGPLPLGWILGVWLAKSTFAIRALGRAAADLRAPLAAGDLEAARTALPALCSRDPAALDGPALAAGAVSSLAENSCDSVVAPLLWLAVGGLPAALAYRAVNTLDAMIGYRGVYERFGKAAARLDDALNYLPARLSALLLLGAGALLRLDAARGWRILRRDGRRTPSPNGGWPMAAMAGLLGVTLVKPGHYQLGDGPPPGPAHIDQAWRLVKVAALLAVAIALAAAWVIAAAQGAAPASRLTAVASCGS